MSNQTETNIPGYLALPAGGKGPGVIVLHAWWGLSDFFKAFCDRLAGEGMVVFAPDLYNGAIATTIEEAERLSDQLDRDTANPTLKAAVTYLRNHPSVNQHPLGMIGFSLGAFLGLWLAQNCPKDIAAAVIFYGTGDGKYDQVRAAFLGHFAEHDPYEPLEGVQKLESTLRGAGREVEFHVYPGTGHWFFEHDRPDAYNADAARIAWERTVSFLHRQVK